MRAIFGNSFFYGDYKMIVMIFSDVRRIAQVTNILKITEKKYEINQN